RRVRPHIGEQQSPELLHRVRLQADLVLEAARLRLERLVDALAARVVLPAVIAAADAVVLDVAVVERRAAMPAELLDAADAARAVAEYQQVLAHQTYPLLGVRSGDLGGG